MKPFHYSHRRLALLAIALALAAALLRGWLPFIYAPSYRPETMTEIPALRITHCIGRYLVDLPVNFELQTGGWGDIELYYGLDKNFQRVYATAKPGRYSREAFWNAVNTRRFALRDTKNDETHGPMLLHGEQVDDSTALMRRLPDEESAGSIKSEVHVMVGPHYVTLEQESYSRDERDITYEKADPAPAEARLKMIASKLMYYERAERAKPGFCMQGVIFDVGQDDEVANFFFKAKEIPDLIFEVDYHAVTGQPSRGLQERNRDAFMVLPMLHTVMATLREGPAALGRLPAEEYLRKSVRPATHHYFDIERRDVEKRSLDRPFFALSLTTGNEYQVPVTGEIPRDTHKASYLPQEHAMVYRRGDASLSDAQVLTLWDGIVASVRKR